MASIKWHQFSNEDDGQTSCDYRGQGELHGQHKTLIEMEFGPDVTTNDKIEAVIANGPAWNKLTAMFLDGEKPTGELGALLGLIAPGAGVRVGVFDH